MIPGSQLADAAARTRIRESLDETLIVEAAAGAGKTTELVNRIVAVLASGRTTIDRLAAVTFTRKAAGELKLRLRQELDRARAAAADPTNLEHALAHLEEAHIGTIHAFCADILRARPVEARIDPAFRELDEIEQPRLFRSAFRQWFSGALDRESPGLERALSRLAHRDYDDRTPAEQLEYAGQTLIEWRDFDGAWRREPFDRAAEIDAMVERLAILAQAAQQAKRPGDALRAALEPAVTFTNWVEKAEQSASRDYDTIEAMLARLPFQLKRNTRKGSGFFSDSVTREQMQEARQDTIARLEEFNIRAGADLAALLRDEMRGLVDAYEKLKLSAGRLDFVDLLIKVRNLLRDRPDVAEWLDGRFTHLFIDEFQDTDPLQVDIVRRLAGSHAGKLFLVGDPKQSIYRFRRADVLLYQSVTRSLADGGASVVHLTSSFRASPNIQRFVNNAFERAMNGDPETGQPAYVPLTEVSPAIDGQPSVVVLPVPDPYGYRDITATAIEASLPEATAAWIDWLLNASGWQVRDLDDPSRLVPVAPRHICLLFRRFLRFRDDMTRPYVRALEARGIPHLLVGGKSFHHREEVETMRAALAAIEWPDDELSVYATLRGSLFAFTDSSLLAYRDAAGRLAPFGKRSDLDAAISEVLDLLARLHRGRNRRPLASTISTLLDAARAHAGFALRPGGNQVLANVHRICDLARSYELTGGISFRGFVEELNEQAERGEGSEAPVIEEGADGVRLMTVHTAKGLEFPVVLLADITARQTAKDPDRAIDTTRNVCATRLLGCMPWDLVDAGAREHDRDLAEGVRLAYVAATRARDLLVVPAVGDKPYDGWLAPLNSAIYAMPSAQRKSVPAPGCPAFGTESIRPQPKVERGEGDSVKPGLHSINGCDVVWWDPNLLDLRSEPFFGLRHQDLLTEDPDSADAKAGERRHAAWRSSRDARVSAGAEPRVTPFIATEAADLPPGAIEVEVASIERDGARPSGRRFGTLVHAVLRDVPLDAHLDRIAAIARRQARLTGSPSDETIAAIESAAEAIRHPLLRRAAAAERLHREWPVSLPLADGRILEGVIDLAFLDNGVWTLVDFKTDAALSAARYRAQLAWYAHAVTALTGLPARAWLLNV